MKNQIEKINYSIIIPHKNCPDLLQRCINSIPKRDDIQIIVVDDNSDPAIVDFGISTEFRRDNIEFYTIKVGKGAGYARNQGLKSAKGKWLIFADADDFFDTVNFNKLLDKYANDINTDIVYLNAISIDDKNIETPLMFSRYIDNYLKNRIYSEKVIRYGMWTPWTRMVKRSLVEINEILFEEIPIGNDAMFCLNCSKYANVITVESDIIYKYYQPSQGSCTSRYYTVDRIRSRLELLERINKLYNEVEYLFRESYFLHYIRDSHSYRFTKEYNQIFHYFLVGDLKIILKNIKDLFIRLLGKAFRII